MKFSFAITPKSEEVAKKKNISKPHQFFGLWIAQSLNEYKYLPLYMKLAKYQDRALLEQAISYLKDYPDAKSKHKLFMWYLKGKLRKMPATAKKKTVKQRKLF